MTPLIGKRKAQQMVLKTSRILLLALVAALASFGVVLAQQVEPTTYCEPQPTIMKDIDRILWVHIVGEDPDQVIFESILIQGKIPPYEPVFVENGEIVTSAYIIRFIGYSGFRPIVGDIESTYTVEYDKLDGSHIILTGEYHLCGGYCEVANDRLAGLDGIVFLADYFWRGGNAGGLEDSENQVMLDMDGNGRADPLDVVFLIERARL